MCTRMGGGGQSCTHHRLLKTYFPPPSAPNWGQIWSGLPQRFGPPFGGWGVGGSRGTEGKAVLCVPHAIVRVQSPGTGRWVHQRGAGMTTARPAHPLRLAGPRCALLPHDRRSLGAEDVTHDAGQVGTEIDRLTLTDQVCGGLAAITFAARRLWLLRDRGNVVLLLHKSCVAPHPPQELRFKRSATNGRSVRTNTGQFEIQGGGKLRGGIISPWDISQRVYFACNLECAVGNFGPTCCEPTFGWCWLWTRLLSIIFHPCKECSRLQAKFASVPCVQQ